MLKNGATYPPGRVALALTNLNIMKLTTYS